MCILRVGPVSPNSMIFYLLEVYPPPQIAKGLLSTPNPSTLLAEEAVLLAELVLLFAHLALLASLCGGGGGGQARPSRLPAAGGCDGGCEV